MRVSAFARVLLSAAVVLGGAALAAAQPSTRPQVKVAFSGQPNEAALMLAVRRGYFEQQGLDVELVRGTATAQDVLVALARNQLQVAARAPSAGLFAALSRGIDLRIVAVADKNADHADDLAYGLARRAYKL